MAGLPFTEAQRRWATRLGLPLLVALFILVITQEGILKLGILERLELASIDYRFQSRQTDPAFRDSANVVIVEISEESFQSLPSRWPWPRSYYARLIRNLKAAGARAVGIDLILGSKDVYSERNDDNLRAAIHTTGIAVLAGKTEVLDERYVRTTSTETFGNIFFPIDSSLGLVNIRNDADGVYRRYSPFFETSWGRRIPTFGFAILNRANSLPPLTTAHPTHDGFAYAGKKIPAYDAASFLINFYGPNGTFRHIKFADVIDDDSLMTTEETRTGEAINTFSDPDYGYLVDGTFKDKIVLVGSTVPEDHDLFPVSIAHGTQTGDNLMYGVEIHANVIESFLRNDFIRKQSNPSEILLVVLLTFVTFLVTSSLKGLKTKHALIVELNGFLFAVAEVFIVGYAAIVLFNEQHYLLTVVSPVVAVVGGYVASTVYHFVLERRQRLLIKSMFSTYVNPTVVEELIKNPEKLALGGERRELTVFFSDIASFTTIAERMPSQKLVELLNEYLSAMTEIVFKNDGTLDKYEGDALMAFWGAPIPQHDHALRACRTAMEMQRELEHLRRSWHDQGKPILNVRIGINTGEMTVGNMGAKRKFDYTVIGDSVNLASRLEGANKLYGTSIMAGQRTYELVQKEICGRELDLITVQGRSEPAKIYELLQLRDGPLENTLEQFLSIYAEALALYRRREWEAALHAFEHALRLRPGDRPSQLHIERARFYALEPPPDNWDGVFAMRTK